jgi:seryl-tRNA synthetase
VDAWSRQVGRGELFPSHFQSSLYSYLAFQLSSASNCTDYQSRRLGIRYRPSPRASIEDLDIPTPAAFEATALYPSQTSPPPPLKTKYAHTLNATAAAIPRLIVALLENGAVLEGEEVVRVRLPEVLRRFWLGKEDGKIEWVKGGEALKL